MKKLQYQNLLSWILITFSIITSTFCAEFIFNRFDSSSISLLGNATINAGVLTLTNNRTFSIGRALYPTKIATKGDKTSQVLPFSTSFIFAVTTYKDKAPGHGMAFLFAPKYGIMGASSGQNLGLFNFSNEGLQSNHVLAVEFDAYKNDDFNDINDNHVGIDVNSLRSVSSYEAGYWDDDDSKSFKKLKFNDFRNYQVWIDYINGIFNVTMAPAGMKMPKKPLLSVSLNLSDVFEEEMYVGFTAATGALLQSHKILAWSFSNTNFSLSDALITRGLPSFVPPETPLHRRKGFIAAITVGLLFCVIASCLVALMMISRRRRIKREIDEMEDWEFDYWPHRISYHEIRKGTKSFADKNVIGVGGNGKVYKGVLSCGTEVAVKHFSIQNGQGIRAFLAEISSLGRLKHRNLVGLRGWCKKEKGHLMLVYDYMKNGSLDKNLFDCDESEMLSYVNRIRVLKQVASGILYLHNGWESKVLHQDIKASNVLLDKDMNAKLGDFGLARMHEHNKTAGTTCVVGTVGYLAPEVVKSGSISTKSDVFSYGVLILETICGRKPIEDCKPPLVEWVWENISRDELINVVDARLWMRHGFDESEVEHVLQLGLLCAHPDSNSRPTMRQVVKFLEGKTEFGDEDLGVLQLGNIKNTDNRRIYIQTLGSDSGSNPTFNEIRQELCSSMSNSFSSTIIQGR